MTDLRNFVTTLGMGDARSLLQSGNLVFDSPVRTGAELERFLESEAHDRLSLDVDFIVRTPEEWKSIIRQNPFRKESERDAKHLVVYFLKAAPEVADMVALQGDIRGPEVAKAKGKQVYVYYPEGQGRSKLTHVILEKRLGRGTGRNWNTVLKLGIMAKTGSARLTPIAPRKKI
jgi:uncharacterized protein (DUF1697 family)